MTIISLINSEREAKTKTYSEVFDIHELEELVLDEEHSQVTSLSARYEITSAYFEGGTLLLDSYSTTNKKVEVMALIYELEEVGIEVKRIKYSSAENIKNYLSNKIGNISKVEKVNVQESLRLFDLLMQRAYELGSEDIIITLSKRDDTAHAQFKVFGEFVPEMHPLKNYAIGRSVCAAVYDGKKGVGETVGSFNDVTTPQEKQVQHIVYDHSGGVVEKLDLRYTKIKTAAAGELLVSIRVLPKPKRLGSLNFSESDMSKLVLAARRSQGITLTCGKTGSGKSTTNLAMVLEVPKSKNIQTFEDPIEIEKPAEYKNIWQNKLDTKVGAETQLKAIMRCVPDGVYVQEIRDEFTAKFATEVAITGHFVISSIHANSAMGIIDRLIDLGVTRSELSTPGMLNTLISQFLVRVLCDNCKVRLSDVAGDASSIDYNYYSRRKPLINAMNISNKEFEKIFVANKDGCVSCKGLGESLRVPLLEIIEVEEKDRQHILSGDREGWRMFRKSKGYATNYDKAFDMMLAGDVDPVRVYELLEG